MPPAFDLNDDAHCAWETLRVSDGEPFRQFVDVSLSSVDAMVDRWKEGGYEALSGWVLHFADRLLSFANVGDESRLAVDLPMSDARLMTFFEDVGAASGGAG